MRYLLVVLGAGEVRSNERFYEIGIGACAGDDIDSEATMYTVDSGTRSQTEAPDPHIIKKR